MIRDGNELRLDNSVPSISSFPSVGNVGSERRESSESGYPKQDAGITLSIVIVTWNCRNFALDCLASLQKDLVETSAEILVVDNASSDGTPEAIAEMFPSVQVIRSDENLGFAKGNNLALNRARGRYLCLLNPDVELVSPCFAPLLAFFEEREDVGLIGPGMLNADRKLARSYMRYPSVWNSFCRALALDNVLARVPGFGGQLMSDFKPGRISDVDVLNGWFWVVRRGAISQVGLLDERFFMYGEDIDWCRRFHEHGWRVVYFPVVRALHYGGACSSNEPIRFSVEMERANLQYWEKYHGPLERAAYIVFCGLHHLVRIMGYSCLTFISPEQNRLRAKIRRSSECLRWLIGFTLHPRRQ